MKHLFILNAFAGKKDVTPELETKIKALGRDDVVIEYTTCKGDAGKIARRYAEAGEPLRVYACGGDGTANEAMCGLIGCRNAALGVIPVGTGNDYVRSLSDDRDGFLDIERMLAGKTVCVDVLCCDGHYALNSVSAGYDLSLIHI